MVTIKDIAKQAGVSHGTVSNVLNNKGNVSVKKIKLVKQAIKELGYISNESAKLLRKGATNTVSLIVPNTIETHYSQFLNGIRNTIDNSKYRLQIFDTLDRPEKEKEILENMAIEQNNSVISISSLKSVNFYEEILPKETNVTFVVRKPQKAIKYFGFNFEQALEDMKIYFENIDKNKIAIVLNESFNPFEKFIVDGLVNCGLFNSANIFCSSVSRLQKDIFSIVQTEKFSHFFSADSSIGSIVKDALNFVGSDEKFIVSISGDDGKIKNPKHLTYFLNYYELGVEVAKHTFFEMESWSEENIVECVGFLNNNQVVPLGRKKANISLLSVPNPTVKAINRIKTNFEKRSSAELNIVETAPVGFEQKLLYSSERYDLIRIDVAQFSMEGQRSLLPLRGLSDDLNKVMDKLLNNGYHKFMTIGNKVLGLPLDPSSQVLFYRKDLFGDSIVQRMYFEQYKSELEVPRTWKKYAEVADFFNNPENKFDISAGVSMNAENVSIIATDFFGAYYSLGGQLNFNDSTSLLNVEIAEQALYSYSLLREGALNELDSWWTNVINNFISGKTAMLVGYMNHLSSIASESIFSVTGYAPVPGNRPLLGGGVLGINKESKNIDAAIDFLLWIFEHQVSRELTRQGGTIATVEVNKLEEFSQTFPWLYDSDKLLYGGIRENTTEKGAPVNLKIIEHTIGTILKEKWRKHPKEVIQEINRSLLKNTFT
ncbi:extracellular solute-binding protein [Enterococcus sp. BWB1-3]|uniref:extracellular solute-binding protein n=1 Tax=Enterococcus sp. BWB1-3 TaxID=2787713 RepID=UPI001922F007|nr:extracellular solute-binding protein [Enterococcus sp. BWB1-3]MBL1229286.1 extracellular solute-binding protein [Enterococcus sp. BWB1-3]